MLTDKSNRVFRNIYFKFSFNGNHNTTFKNSFYLDDFIVTSYIAYFNKR